MKRQIKIISLSLIILLLLQITFPIITNIEIFTSYALTGISYITTADSITYVGNDSIGAKEQDSDFGKISYAVYSNTSVNSSKYVLFSNAVNANGTKYDLVLYPFKTGTKDPRIVYNTGKKGKTPGFYCSDGDFGCKIVITEHNYINRPVNMKVMLGVADLDKNEYVALPSNFSTREEDGRTSRKWN